MDKIKRKIIYIILLCLVAVALTNTMSYAATTTFGATSNNIKVGQSTTINVGINSTETWDLKVTASGGTLSGTTTSTDAEGEEVTKNVISCTFSASTPGTYTITLSGSVAGSDLKIEDVSKVINITVEANSSTGGNTGGSTGGTTNKPTVTEPKFTSVSKTVYATSDINLRSSWSTSSSATRIPKGTELRLTGTSTETVNGYVWYRVTYNGQVKYVSKNLITEKKPEDTEAPTPEEPTTEKSKNANLKTLKIEGVELTPTFNADKTEYTIKLVNYEEEDITVIAEAEDEKAKVKIEGNTNLALGENTITITVTAEDGTTKTYKIIATKEEAGDLRLQTLKIKDIELKDFSPDKYEYEIEFKDLEKLEIEAIANEEGATIEILGNEELVDGENIITIIVTSADGEQTITYQIKANKLASQEEKKELNIKSIIISAIIALVILIVIIILIVKYVKHNNNQPFIDYEYQDNLKDKEESEFDSNVNEKEPRESIEKENIEPEENEYTQTIYNNNEKQTEEPKETTQKVTIDDLYANYEDDEDQYKERKRRKGKHSK